MHQVQALATALFFALCINANAQSSSARATESIPPLIAVAASEDANGVTQADFNLAMLKDFEQRTVAAIQKKMVDHMRSQGDSFPPPKLRSEAHYMEAGKPKLAIVRLLSSGSINQVFTFGIVGAELRRVACIRTENFDQSIPVFSGVCGNKIRETYGISLQSK